MSLGSASNFFLGAASAGGSAVDGPIKSLRFNDANSAYLNKTPGSAGNQKIFTFSTWIKLTSFGSGKRTLFAAGDNSSLGMSTLEYDGSYNQFWFRSTVVGGTMSAAAYTNALWRDPSAWYHLVMSVDTTQATEADRLKMYINGVSQTFITYSVPLDGVSAINATTEHRIGRASSGSDYLDDYLADVYFIDGQALNATDFGAFDANGVWQASTFSGTYGTNGFHLFDFAKESTIGHDSSGNENDYTATNFTSSVSGSTAGISSTKPLDVTGDWVGVIGIAATSTSGEPNAVFPDGGGLDNTSGRFSWSGLTVGDTLTVYLTTSDTSNRAVYGDVDESTTGSTPGGTLGTITLTVSAASGSAKIDFNSTANIYGITPGPLSSRYFDDVFDSPTNGTQDDTGVGGEVSGNYAVFNPLRDDRSGYNEVPVNGNLETNPRGDFVGTIPLTSGLWYWEITIKTQPSAGQAYIGVVDANQIGESGARGWATDQIAAMRDTGAFYGDGSTGTAVSYAAGDILGFALDIDSGKLYIAKNNTWVNSGDPAAGTGEAFYGLTMNSYTPLCSEGTAGNYCIANFGQMSFVYTAPTNFKAICTKNVEAPTITNGSTECTTFLYTGNDEARDFTGIGLAPDIVWIKKRLTGTGNHSLADTVRGATLNLVPNDSQSEGTEPSYVTDFGSDGFSIGSSSIVNNLNDTYVAWLWNSGTAPNTSVSAGGLNSSLLDQSRTWSGGTSSGTIYSGAWSEVFNNVETNTYSDGNSVYVYQNTATLNFATALPEGSIQIWGRAGSTGAVGDKVTFSDGSNTYTTGDVSTRTAQWINVDSGNSLSGITSVTVHSGGTSGSGMVLGAIRIDGKKLVDSSVSVTLPSIATTYRANPSAGISICSYVGENNAGDTVAHGLNVAPEWIIVKNRDVSLSWYVYHKEVGATKYLRLDLPNDAATGAGAWNNTVPTSSVFSLGQDNNVNDGGKNYIAYVFAPVTEFSKFGKYEGFADADGPFVYTGFRPSFIMLKNMDAGSTSWTIHDEERNGFNFDNDLLFPDTDDSENTTSYLDILSNGFKLRIVSSFANTTNTFVYAAFAKNPFQTNGGLAR